MWGPREPPRLPHSRVLRAQGIRTILAGVVRERYADGGEGTSVGPTATGNGAADLQVGGIDGPYGRGSRISGLRVLPFSRIS
jgi:hypothetical protein